VEGRVEGRVEGIVATRQEVLLTLLEDRFGSVDPSIEERIRACTDPARLHAAFRKMLHAASADELPL
jgi:hypothetical protein